MSKSKKEVLKEKKIEDRRYRDAQIYLIQEIFDALEISASDETVGKYPLGDYIVKVLSHRQLSEAWAILNGDKPVESRFVLYELTTIHSQWLSQQPSLPPVRFSGKADEILRWLKAYVCESGVFAVVDAYHERVPLEDLVS